MLMLTKLVVSPETSVISADCSALDFDAHIYRNILKRKVMTLAELPNLFAIAVTSETWLVERLFIIHLHIYCLNYAE